jgi:hypothetical protein
VNLDHFPVAHFPLSLCQTRIENVFGADLASGRWRRIGTPTRHLEISVRLERNCNPHEGGRYKRARILTLVLRVREFHELIMELFSLPILLSGFDGVHGRAIKPFKQVDELRWAFVG